MTNRTETEILTQLLARIERSWKDTGDRSVVYALSVEYPNLREELYEFFEDLVLGAGEAPDSSTRASETRVRDWLQATGFKVALDAALRSNQTTSTQSTEAESKPLSLPHVTSTTEGQEEKGGETWIAFLRRSTGKRIGEVASALHNVNAEYLVLVSRHSHLVPNLVKQELARCVNATWGVPVDETLRPLETRQRFLQAASRPRDFDAVPTSFEEILERSALGPDQRQFWRKLAGA